MLLLALVRDRNTWTPLDRKRQIYSKSECLFLCILPIVRISSTIIIPHNVFFLLNLTNVMSDMLTMFYKTKIRSCLIEG
jgi:hypothetical protein